METTSYVKSEAMPGRRLFSSVEVDDRVPKIVKRRRRELVPPITTIHKKRITWRLRPQDNNSVVSVPMSAPQLIDNGNSIEEFLSSSSSHQKQEAVVQTRMPLMSNPQKSSSTTALGLLLRSSMFRELVDKNSK